MNEEAKTWGSAAPPQSRPFLLAKTPDPGLGKGWALTPEAKAGQTKVNQIRNLGGRILEDPGVNWGGGLSVWGACLEEGGHGLVKEMGLCETSSK